MCTQMGHHFSYLIWVTIWHMNPLFTSVFFDNLFTKHSTHMTYISRPLVRKFCFLQIRGIDLSKFEIIQTILRNQLTLTPIFFASSIFSFYNPQVTSLIWQACFTRRSFNIYMCVVLVFFLTSCMSIFAKFFMYGWLCKQNITCQRWKRCNRILSDIALGRNYPTAGYNMR